MKHRCVNGKARVARVGMISASLMVIMIMVMSQTALAYTNHVVEGTGLTSITSIDCDADVPEGPPESLNVANGDDVTIYYNYTYSDLRGLGSARHQFVLIVNGWAKEESYITYGSGGGIGTILKTVYNVQEHGQIWVGYYANITCLAEQCYDSDQKGDYIDLT